MLSYSRIARYMADSVAYQSESIRTHSVSVLMLSLCTLAVSCAHPPVVGKNNEVYHCVGMNKPSPPPNTFSKPTPLEKFEYGIIQDENRPTTGTWRNCRVMPLPATAYLRYKVEGRVIEKTFDLSSLTPRRVYKKDVVFYVDGDEVEVRLVKLSSEYPSTIEVVTRK